MSAGALGILAVGFFAGRARAGGIPAKGALTYSGLLQDAKGAPLAGPEYVEIQFWDDATKTAPADLLCDTGTPAVAQLVNGRFSVPLPDLCTTKVAANPNVFVDVIVGPTVDEAASLGTRSKLGAVPYAVEAGNAARLNGLDAAALQSRVTGTCPAGQAASGVNADGSLTCVATVTPWNLYTPAVVLSSAGFPAATGVDNSSGRWRRVGDSVEIILNAGFAATSTDASSLIWGLPNGLKAATGFETTIGGYAEAWSGVTATTCIAQGFPGYGGFSLDCNGGASLRRSDVGPKGSGKEASVGIHFTVPIAGWTLTTP